MDKLQEVLWSQAEDNGDEIWGTPRPYIRIQREDAVYEVGYTPDWQTEAEYAQFVAKWDSHGNDWRRTRSWTTCWGSRVSASTRLMKGDYGYGAERRPLGGREPVSEIA